MIRRPRSRRRSHARLRGRWGLSPGIWFAPRGPQTVCPPRHGHV